jgi:hypothetical protein
MLPFSDFWEPTLWRRITNCRLTKRRNSMTTPNYKLSNAKNVKTVWQRRITNCRMPKMSKQYDNVELQIAECQKCQNSMTMPNYKLSNAKNVGTVWQCRITNCRMPKMSKQYDNVEFPSRRSTTGARYPLQVLGNSQGGQMVKPKFPIWLNFGVSCIRSCYYSLWPFGLFYGHLVYFVAIWYILWSFWYIFPFRQHWPGQIL